MKELEKNCKSISTKEEIAQVAAISANDKKIGTIVAEGMEKAGDEGVITVEEAKSLATELDVVEGMQFDRGYKSAYFVTNADKMVAELEDAYILVSEKKLATLQPLLPLLEAVVQAGNVVVAHSAGAPGHLTTSPSGASRR